MSTVFSDFVRSLADRKPLTDAGWTALLDNLRGALVHEMKRRSLWRLPPSCLGIAGAAHWDDGDALEELLHDCYAFIFLRRLPGLVRQLRVRPNVDGLVFLNIRNFLHEARKRHDPLGYRIFEIAHGAVGRLLEEGRLHAVDGDPKVRNDTVLAFAPWGDPRAADGVDLSDAAASWCDALLPELVVTWHTDPLVAALAGRIGALAEGGIDAFRFRDLVDPLKAEVRRRWQALGDGGETALEEDAAGLPVPVRRVDPEAAWEERRDFEALLACVDRRLRDLAAPGKTGDYLRRLWLYVRSELAEGGDAEKLPSDQRLGELLDVPRGRLGELRGRLAELIASCRGGRSGRSGELPVRRLGTGRPTTGGEARGMDLDRRREALRRQTVEMAAKLDDETPAPPAKPGHTYLDATGSVPVEWAVLERRGDRLRVAPVDDHPLAGGHDVAVDETRWLRCGAATWIDPGALDPRLASGRVSDDVLVMARQKLDAGAARSPEDGDDRDPEYVDWLATLQQAGRRLANGAPLRSLPARSVPVPSQAERRPAPPRVWQGIAAGLAALAVGLGLWNRQLTPGDATPSILFPADSESLFLQDRQRSFETVRLTVTATHGLLFLVLADPEAHPAYRVELVPEGDAGTPWTSGRVEPQGGEIHLLLPRAWLRASTYRLRLWAWDDRSAPLDERPVRITVGPG